MLEAVLAASVWVVFPARSSGWTDDQARRLQRLAAGPSVPALIALERQKSASYSGRSVLGWERNQAPVKVGNIEGR